MHECSDHDYLCDDAMIRLRVMYIFYETFIVLNVGLLASIRTINLIANQTLEHPYHVIKLW